jgi:hypothetical protein
VTDNIRSAEDASRTLVVRASATTTPSEAGELDSNTFLRLFLEPSADLLRSFLSPNRRQSYKEQNQILRDRILALESVLEPRNLPQPHPPAANLIDDDDDDGAEDLVPITSIGTGSYTLGVSHCVSFLLRKDDVRRALDPLPIDASISLLSILSRPLNLLFFSYHLKQQSDGSLFHSGHSSSFFRTLSVHLEERMDPALDGGGESRLSLLGHSPSPKD